MYVCIHLYIYTPTYIYICMYVCIVTQYVCMYVYIYTPTYIYVCIYILYIYEPLRLIAFGAANTISSYLVPSSLVLAEILDLVRV